MNDLDSPDPPFDGDPAWRRQCVLGDGTCLTLRPIAPEDKEELRRAFHTSSARTRYLRFFGVVGEPSEEMLRYLTCVDQKDHVAIVATITSPDLKDERGVAVARFVRLKEAPDVAEAAITVSDEMQRRGVGTLLAREIERAARVRGIKRLRAEVLADNAAMRAILDQAGAKVDGSMSNEGTVAYEIPLDALDPEKSTFSRWMRSILRGAAETMAMTIRRLMPPDSQPTPAPSSGRSDASDATAARVSDDDDARR